MPNKASFAALDSAGRIERQNGLAIGKHRYISEEYIGLSPVQVAKKAANKASNNGACWWIYKYVYTSHMCRKS